MTPDFNQWLTRIHGFKVGASRNSYTVADLESAWNAAERAWLDIANKNALEREEQFSRAEAAEAEAAALREAAILPASLGESNIAGFKGWNNPDRFIQEIEILQRHVEWYRKALSAAPERGKEAKS